MKKISWMMAVALLIVSSYFYDRLGAPTVRQTSLVVPEQLKQNWLKIVESHRFNGALLISIQGQICLSQGFGYANKEQQIRNTPSTQFPLASITKILTAAAILKLVDEKKIDENLPIAAYLPPEDPIWAGAPPCWIDQVTVHHLLTHSSGLESYVKLPHFDTFYSQPQTTADLMQFLASARLQFKPGTRFEYSGSGYNLLGAVIERVSHMRYGQYLTTQFFKPLGMSSSFAPDALFLSQVQRHHPSVALGYNVESHQHLALAGDINFTTAFAEASVISTPLDMYTWTKALFSLKIISEQSLYKMTFPYLETPEKDLWIGEGLFIDQTQPNHLLYCHTGRINGYESFWCYQPANNMTIIALSNEMNGSTYAMAELLVQSVATGNE